MSKCQNDMRIKSQHGVSMIELLITVVIGLFITAALISLFMGSRQSFKMTEGISQVQESGRLATLLLIPIARQAGYVPEPVNTHTDLSNIFKASLHKLPVLGMESFSSTHYPQLSASKVLSSADVLAVSYMGQSNAGAVETPLKTCLGDDVNENQIAVIVFYIQPASANATASLNCYTNISNMEDALTTGVVRNEVIISGIVDMQILYGIDTDADRTANRFLAATAVGNWQQVTSAQITFSVNSLDKITTAASTTEIINGRVTKKFSVQVNFRNHLAA